MERKMKTSRSTSRAVTLFVTVILSCAFAGQASAIQCRSWPTAGWQGLAISKDKAKKRARSHWATRVLFTAGMGKKWNYWPAAIDKRYDCHKKHGTWRCVAAAKPCKLWY
jgi:hypothetical protein